MVRILRYYRFLVIFGFFFVHVRLVYCLWMIAMMTPIRTVSEGDDFLLHPI
jgi:hypothetical protein